MQRTRFWVGLIAALMLGGLAPVAQAQFAVIDVGAIAQLIQQVNTLREQLETARRQLDEAQRAYESMTGGRGMERLLGNTVRNYLPPDWAELAAAVDSASATYGALAVQVQAVLNANAVLNAGVLARLSIEERQQLEAARRSAALLQAVTRQALATTSQRFAAIQQLIDAIPGASDPKAILDLQARIQAEQGMLQNESTKLSVLYQTAQAEEWARRQRSREHAVAGIGSLRDLPPMGLRVE